MLVFEAQPAILTGGAPEPDKWLTVRAVSAGSGRGPILVGKLEAGGGSLASTQRATNSYVKLQGDILPHAKIFSSDV
jgi:hypothetical protein